MSDTKENPRPPMTEFEKRRYMRTFKDLFDLCKCDPVRAVILINEYANTPDVDPYTNEAAVYFLLGILQGICAVSLSGHETSLNGTINNHAAFNDLKPSDFLGTGRKYGKLYP